MPQALADKRRMPVQQRSVVTVDTILEAVARILESGGETQFTTNHVAEKAGYSIGTLYRYFPNKQSLLLALVRREIVRQEAMLRRQLAAGTGLSPDALARQVLRCALQPFAERRGLQRAMMDWLLSEREIANLAAAVGDSLMPLLVSALAPGPINHCARTHPVARQATIGTVVGAILLLGRNDPACLHEPEVEDELVRLLLHGLRSS